MHKTEGVNFVNPSEILAKLLLPLNDDGNHILPEILKKYQFSRPR